MRRLSGQAARLCGTILHRLAHLALGTAISLAVLLGAAAWRLSQGPVNLSWLTARLEAAANANGGPVRLSIGGTALAWEGFRLGVDRPIDLRLTDVRLTSAGGVQHVDLPRAEVSLSLAALLLGRVQPRAVELDGARLTLRRAADGTLNLDLGSPPATGDASAASAAGSPLPALLAVLARPPTTDRTSSRNWLGQIRRFRIHDATLSMIDSGLGVTWQAPRVEIDLSRHAQGGVEGTFDLTLAVGNTQARLSGTATLSASATATQVTARLTPVTPAALAQQIPALARLAVLDTPIGTRATLQFGPHLHMTQMHVTLRANPGTLQIGASAVPMLGATLVVSGTPDNFSLDSAHVALRGRSGSPISTLTASGTLRRAGERFNASVALGVDQVDFADLPILWPQGIGGGARAWVTQNITSGIAHDGHAEITVTCRDDFSGMTVTRASGTLDGSDLDVAWLRPVPPLTHGQAQLRIVDPDTLDIVVRSAQQPVSKDNEDLTVTGGSMRITGLLHRDQIGAIRADVAGKLAAVITLLRDKRLHLLSDHPIALKDPSGNATGSLTVQLPLDADVRMDDIAIRATAHLTDAHLGGVVAGRDVDGGSLDLVADNDGLTVKGNALLAGIPSALDATMDFRAGPATQTLQRVTVIGRPTAAQLARAGLDATDLLTGPMDLRAVLTEHRDGGGDIQLSAGLTGTVFRVTPLAWEKPAGVAAKATADLRLSNDRLVGISGITLDGDGVALRGDVEREGDRGTLLHLDRLVLGRTELAGTVRLPPSPNAAPIVIDVSGPQIDLSARLTQHAARKPPPKTEPPPGPPWTLDAHFDKALMAHGYVVEPLTVTAANDGAIFTRLRLAGRTGDKGPFALQVGPKNGVRRLTANAANAGDLLRALDVIDTMQGGTLTISAVYNDADAGHALTGTAEITGFRMRQAAALGRLLQAMTLYGLVDVLRGPGLAFARLVAPFRLTDGVLELTDARAFSPSLGLTVKGRIDTNDGQADLQGTIVPAYFFNSLLGKVPLVGRLFSPERGGGVFAASYSIRGPLGDPAVSVNPLAALTPGFLRGVFGIF